MYGNTLNFPGARPTNPGASGCHLTRAVTWLERLMLRRRSGFPQPPRFRNGGSSGRYVFWAATRTSPSPTRTPGPGFASSGHSGSSEIFSEYLGG